MSRPLVVVIVEGTRYLVITSNNFELIFSLLRMVGNPIVDLIDSMVKFGVRLF